MKISQDIAILFFANTPKKDASGKTPFIAVLYRLQ